MSSQAATDLPIRVYDPEEAASILRCKVSWLKEQARRRQIPFTMLGGQYRWTDAHLAEIIRLGEQALAPPAQVPRRRTSPASDSVPMLRARPPPKPRSTGPNGAGPAPPRAAGAPDAA